jgi:peptidoglycan/LPS O-acetylase OafA/YrhL
VDNTATPTVAPARLWSLDVLRGLCAGIVFLSHWHLWSDFAPRPGFEAALRRAGDVVHDTLSLLTWPTGGHHPAVLGFFVLSGFCIHYPFERRALEGGTAPDWPDYFRRRFRRIMPVYWAACALGLGFVIAETLRPSGSPLLTLHAMSSAGDAIIRAVGLAGVVPREIFAGNYILTTVTVEIFMYAAYPLFYRYAGRGRWRELGLAFVALHLLSIGMLRYFTPYWVFNSVFMLGVFWHAGAYAAHLYLTGRGRVSGIWLLLAWMVFLVLKSVPHFTGLNLLKQAAWGLVCTLGILWAVDLERRRPYLGDLVFTRALRSIGTISYSLYAMHTPAIMLATWALLHLGIREYLIQLAATMAASVAATAAAHYGLERTFYRPRVDPAPMKAPAAL